MIKREAIFPIIFLLIFFIVGLFIYQDFGVTIDEPNQYQVGHVIWKYLCQKFGASVPEPIKEVPGLHHYINRYYGQAVTFPTVVMEALKNFTMDISTVARIRHLWNFLNYTAGLCCFAILIFYTHGYTEKGYLYTSLGLLFMMFLPRIYGDIFYNDRDTMLLAWSMISLTCFYWFERRPGWISGLFCAFAFAITYNVRLFGFVLLLFPAVFFRYSRHRKSYLLMVLASILFWIMISPVYWDDPVHDIPNSFTHLATVQRLNDTNGEGTLEFFGQTIKETELPWYYLPVYIFITTPVVTSLFSGAGIVVVIKKIRTDYREKCVHADTLIGIAMLIILFPFLMIVIMKSPILYNGWRHFYFLYLPIIWLAVESLDIVFSLKKPLLKNILLTFLCLSFVPEFIWMVKAHPYHCIYLNSAFREKWSGKFSGDYWDLAPTDAMKWLLNNVESYSIQVADNNMFFNSMMGFPPSDRYRFHPYRSKIQPYPIEYSYLRYDKNPDSEIQIEHYSPVYTISRDNIIMGEVFQRTHFSELLPDEIIENITSESNSDSVTLMADGDFNTVWYNPERQAEISMKLNKTFMLTALEIFPAEEYDIFPEITLAVSNDGNIWTTVPCDQKSGNDLGFSPVETEWIKLTFGPDVIGIRDMILYGF